MSSGGGTTTTTQNTVSSKELPAWLDQAAQRNIARANMVSDIGYTPYYGLDTAGFSDMQNAGFQNTANAASAFGLSAPSNANAYMPQTTTNNLGFTGYSSGTAFDNALNQLAANRPAQYTAIQSQFTDPWTGVASLPTALDVIYNPDSTPEQIAALTGSIPFDGNASSDNNADQRTALEKYMDAKSYLRGDTMIDKLLAMTTLGAIATPLSKNYMTQYEDKYGISNVNGVQSTSNPDIAKRLGIEYNPAAQSNLLVSSNANGNPASSNSYSMNDGGTMSWNDFGGYTGVTGTGVNMGNDWENF